MSVLAHVSWYRSDRQWVGHPSLVGSPSWGPAPALFSPGEKLCQVCGAGARGGDQETGCCLEDGKADVTQYHIT